MLQRYQNVADPFGSDAKVVHIKKSKRTFGCNDPLTTIRSNKLEKLGTLLKLEDRF